VVLLSGPNLNLLGQREPEIYGTATLDEHVATFTQILNQFGHEVRHTQSNFEGDLVEAVQEARRDAGALVINPGALTHYSWSLHDALASFDGPIIEVHLSNPALREPFRHQSVVAPVALGTIAGFAGRSYLFAAHAVVTVLAG
jgi:3-dehydroquinate dehydratase-2